MSRRYPGAKTRMAHVKTVQAQSQRMQRAERAFRHTRCGGPAPKSSRTSWLERHSGEEYESISLPISFDLPSGIVNAAR